MEKQLENKENNLISVDNFSFYYPEQSVAALKHINLDVDSGEFLLLCGVSGSGKSTLLRQLKSALAPSGQRSGWVCYRGTPLEEVSHRIQSEKIGFVQQSPDNQIVTDKVWHELAFGLESLGLDTPTIRRRVAEMASFFGIQGWFHHSVSALSGGQKQLLNLASIMVMQPELLILDEPTSQLDPIAATEFLGVLGKINRELGTTIMLTEHRLEEALPLASRVVAMDNGAIVVDGTARAVGEWLKEHHHPMYSAMPTPMRVWSSVSGEGDCPITVSDGRQWLSRFTVQHPVQSMPQEDGVAPSGKTVLSAHEVWFRYQVDGQDVVRGLSLDVKCGEFVALLGGNGTGKTTSLKLLSGLVKPQRGEIIVDGKMAVLPQNPQTIFVKKTVREDLFEAFDGLRIPQEQQNETVGKWVARCHLEHLLERHPYDLSGGEQQRVALCKVLLLNSEILLLDEPTKGLDSSFKEELAEILEGLRRQGVTILMVSHDVEFCASYASRCALFFDGAIVTEGTSHAFFPSNSFYTTAANRMSRGVIEGVVTCEDLICSCGGTMESRKQSLTNIEVATLAISPPQKEKIPQWRRWLAYIAGVVALVLFGQIVSVSDLTAFVGSTGLSQLGQGSVAQNLGLIGALILLTLAVGRRRKKDTAALFNSKISRRTQYSCAAILLSIPLTLYLGITYFGGRQYYFIALLVLFQCMTPFFLVFEGRKPQTRELVTIAVLCAIAVAGRAAFFMLPQFKPVIAICIISGIALGGETGFLVGALSMLVSNMLFSQGPWTPWQMFATGIIGFLAGLVFQKGWLRPTRISMSLFGLLSAIIVYGGIMNGSSMFLWTGEWNPSVLTTYYITGFPMDVIHGLATGFFLWLIGEPMLEKIDRLKTKYGLLR